MPRHRVLIAASFALNCALAAALYQFSQRLPPADVEPQKITFAKSVNAGGASAAQPQVVVRQQNFTWADIESEDYGEYIRHLREIGCPESTIRDIIVAEVNEHFDRQIESLRLKSDSQWWRPNPSALLLEELMPKLTALDVEKNSLLTKLLGDNWSPDVADPADLLILSGPVLSRITGAKRAQVLEIHRRHEAGSLTDQDGKPTGMEGDPAKIDTTLHAQLSQLLSPAELEEYLLRHSNLAESLREDLSSFQPTPDEFRLIFRTTDKFHSQLESLLGKTDAPSVARRSQLEQEQAAEIKRILPPSRYETFALTQDKNFQLTESIAAASGVPESAVIPLHQIAQVSSRERLKITTNKSLSEADKALAFQVIEEEETAALRRLLGNETSLRYQLKKAAQQLDESLPPAIPDASR